MSSAFYDGVRAGLARDGRLAVATIIERRGGRAASLADRHRTAGA